MSPSSGLDELSRPVALAVVGELRQGRDPHPVLHGHEHVAVTEGLLTVGAEAVHVLTDITGRPWRYDERVWHDELPELRPRTRSGWAHLNYALHAVGCRAGGVELDWPRQESFWHIPLWPSLLDVLALLLAEAHRHADLTPADVAARLHSRLAQHD